MKDMSATIAIALIVIAVCHVADFIRSVRLTNKLDKQRATEKAGHAKIHAYSELGDKIQIGGDKK